MLTAATLEQGGRLQVAHGAPATAPGQPRHHEVR